MQKALYPEGERVCQCVIVHPPGGIVGGDGLRLDVALGEGAHAQLTTPGAAKWYRSAGPVATQVLRARVAGGALLEWMPQGNILYDGAHASLATEIVLDGDAAFIGWDACCLGRTASAEPFVRGSFRQRFEIVQHDALIWSERAKFAGDSPLFASPVGLYGSPIFGTFVAVGSGLDDDILARCRALPTADGECALTRLPELVVARFRGATLEAAHRCFARLWAILRPAMTGRTAVPPRIWST